MKQMVCLALAALFLLPAVLFAQESLAERKLRQMVEEEQSILREAQREGGSDERLLEQRFQDLVHKYDVFIQENPEFPVGYVAYGRLLERIGQEEAARVMFIKANQLDPNIALVKNQLGNFLVEEEEFAQALPYYLAAIELEPEEAVYHYQLGELLHQFREGFLEEKIFTRKVIDEKMLEAFGNAAKHGSEEAAFAYRFAEAFYDLEEPRWEEALRAWSEVEKKAAAGIEKETIYLHRANIAFKRGELEKARELLGKIQEPFLRRNKASLEEEIEAAAAGE